MSYTSFRKWKDARPDQLFAWLKSSYRLYDSLVLAKDPAACHFQTVLKEDKEPLVWGEFSLEQIKHIGLAQKQKANNHRIKKLA